MNREIHIITGKLHGWNLRDSVSFGVNIMLVNIVHINHDGTRTLRIIASFFPDELVLVLFAQVSKQRVSYPTLTLWFLDPNAAFQLQHGTTLNFIFESKRWRRHFWFRIPFQVPKLCFIFHISVQLCLYALCTRVGITGQKVARWISPVICHTPKKPDTESSSSL